MRSKTDRRVAQGGTRTKQINGWADCAGNFLTSLCFCFGDCLDYHKVSNHGNVCAACLSGCLSLRGAMLTMSAFCIFSPPPIAMNVAQLKMFPFLPCWWCEHETIRET